MGHTTLLCLLYGSQSWSTKSKFTQRDAGHEPSKAGFGGLVVNAVGFREEGWLLPEFNKCLMGVRVDRQGDPLEEFCTAGGGTLAGKPYGAVCASTVDVLKPKFKDHPIIVRKTCWDDAAFLVGLQGERAFLEMIEKALIRPSGVLCLGRKQFLPRLPLFMPPTGIRNCPLEEALENEPWTLMGNQAFADQEPEQVRAVIEATAEDRRASRLVDDVALDYKGPRRRTSRYVVDRVITLKKG